MSAALPPSSPTTSGSNNFFRPIDWSKDDDWSYLSIGQSEWRSPTLPGAAGERQLLRELAICKAEALRLSQRRQFFSVKRIGGYVRIRRLPDGPVRKLSDWILLQNGDCMLAHPAPTEADLKEADTRIWYLSQKGERGYHLAIDHGGLWVCRGHTTANDLS